MSSNRKRQLAAIMFADIQGYTQLMQQDEAKASRSIVKFKNELNDKVKAFDGRVVQFYGDGCLSTFNRFTSLK